MGVFAQGVGHHFDRAYLERPIDFVARRRAEAGGRNVVRQEVELIVIRGIGRLIELILPQIADVAVVVQRERVVQKRLAEPEEIQLRQVLRLHEERIYQPRAGKFQRHVVPHAPQAQAGNLVFLLIPFLLVIFLQEVAVGHLADFQLQLEIVGELLLMAQ